MRVDFRKFRSSGPSGDRSSEWKKQRWRKCGSMIGCDVHLEVQFWQKKGSGGALCSPALDFSFCRSGREVEKEWPDHTAQPMPSSGIWAQTHNPTPFPPHHHHPIDLALRNSESRFVSIASLPVHRIHHPLASSLLANWQCWFRA